MIRVRVILLIIGYFLTILGLAMNIPLIVDLFHHNKDWEAFLVSEFFTLFIGVSLAITCRESNLKDISIREAFILTTCSWITLVFFASLPIYFSELNLSYVDSFFESMSSLTTTGATIITNLDNTPPGILVWRSFLEWVGGIGIIVMAIAVLPFLRIGGMQLFKTESSDKSHKIMPRAKQLSIAIGLIYLSLTIICSVALYLAGMSLFDAILHAMTSVSTGGFSTHDLSIAYFNDLTIELIIMFFITLGAIPFPIHIKLFQGKWKAIQNDQQVYFFFLVLLILITITVIWLMSSFSMTFERALRVASFNVIAIITTTGYSSTDYSLWGEPILTLLFLISVIGGCTGSTSGGIKIFRFQILYATAKYQIFRLIQPHGVYRVQYNNQSLSDAVGTAVMGFFLIFCFCFFIIAILLSFTGLDFMTSLSGAAATIANVGPGLGNIIGPAGNYSTVSDFAKWVISIGMLIGRLEIFTIFVLFSAAFWRD